MSVFSPSYISMELTQNIDPRSAWDLICSLLRFKEIKLRIFPSLCRFDSLNYLVLKMGVTLDYGTLSLCKILLGNSYLGLTRHCTHAKITELHFKTFCNLAF